MSISKIKKNDMVIAIAGKNKGIQGAVLKVINNRLIKVEGLNIVKKHIKSNSKTGIQGGIIKKEAPIDISNVAIYNPNTQKADRVGVKFIQNKDHKKYKVRIFKSTKKLIDN